MSTQHFFKESTEQSRIKTRIVSKYFSAWAQVMISATNRMRGDRIAFIDLFAGPGSYEDKVPSTPMRVLGAAAKNQTLREMLVTMFNDAEPKHVHLLEEDIAYIPGLEQFRHRPQVSNFQVGEEVVSQLEEARLVPTLLFVDP